MYCIMIITFRTSFADNRSEWLICDDDIFPSTPQTSKRFNARNMRCNNCREKGHRAQDCYQPPKPVRCHMCGDGGHREPRCPNTICLRVSSGDAECVAIANYYILPLVRLQDQCLQSRLSALLINGQHAVSSVQG